MHFLSYSIYLYSIQPHKSNVTLTCALNAKTRFTAKPNDEIWGVICDENNSQGEYLYLLCTKSEY